MKKTLLTLLALAPMAVFAEDTKYWVPPTEGNLCYWVNGFDLNDPSTWVYDADKYNNKEDGDPAAGDRAADAHYCWAASAANIIAQWESKNADFVRSTQKRDPKTAQGLYDEFVATFKNISGETVNATAWYFTGETYGLQFKAGATNTAGGYYKDLVKFETEYGNPMSLENSGWTLTPDGDFPTWDPDVYNTPGNDLFKQFTNNLTQCLVNGYSVGIAADGVYDNNGKPGYYSHALTLWGIEVNPEGHLTRMWLTDSDDATSFGKDMGLFSVSCEEIPEILTWGNSASAASGEFDPVLGNLDYFSMKNDVDFDGKFWYKGYDGDYGDYLSSYSAIKITPLVNYNTPEPTTGTLSLLALAGLAARRRRK